MRYFTVILFVFFSINASSVFASGDTPPTVYSDSGLLIDALTGEVLFEKNSNEKMYPASVTKILTGIIAVEEGNLDEIVTVSQGARYVEGTRIYLSEGEQKPLNDLVYGLLINSGNDAAIAIAEHMDETVEAFSDRMNRFANRLGMTNSHFMNPHGLFHKDHYTTASDMAILSRYVMNNDLFKEVVSTKKMPWFGDEWESNLVNHNLLLWRYQGATGIKNGYTSKSGHTLIGSAERDGRQLIAVAMGANLKSKIYQDVQNMLDFGFDHFRNQLVFKKGDKIEQFGKEYYANEDFYVTLKSDSLFDITVEDSGEIIVIETESNSEVKQEKQIGQMKVLKFAEMKQSELAIPESDSSISSEDDGSISRMLVITTIMMVGSAIMAQMVIRQKQEF